MGQVGGFHWPAPLKSGAKERKIQCIIIQEAAKRRDVAAGRSRHSVTVKKSRFFHGTASFRLFLIGCMNQVRSLYIHSTKKSFAYKQILWLFVSVLQIPPIVRLACAVLYAVSFPQL